MKAFFGLTSNELDIMEMFWSKTEPMSFKEIMEYMSTVFKKEWKRFLQEEDGMGVVEVILIVVVLISLVALFKTQIQKLVSDILKKVTENAKKI